MYLTLTLASSCSIDPARGQREVELTESREAVGDDKTNPDTQSRLNILLDLGSEDQMYYYEDAVTDLDLDSEIKEPDHEPYFIVDHWVDGGVTKDTAWIFVGSSCESTCRDTNPKFDGTCMECMEQCNVAKDILRERRKRDQEDRIKELTENIVPELLIKISDVKNNIESTSQAVLELLKLRRIRKSSG